MSIKARARVTKATLKPSHEEHHPYKVPKEEPLPPSAMHYEPMSSLTMGDLFDIVLDNGRYLVIGLIFG